MKILIAPDSFKGSLSSTEICSILEEGLARLLPSAEIVSIPVADGGEGTLDAFNCSKPGRMIYAKATDPWFNEIEAPYLFYEKSGSGIATAVIESAKVAGFISPARGFQGNDSSLSNDSSPDADYLPAGKSDFTPDPTRTTTYGLGLLIRDALSRGARKIIVGLGGSCTNDGGCGMAAALGTKFYGMATALETKFYGTPGCSQYGNASIPTGETSIPTGNAFIPTGGTFIPTGEASIPTSEAFIPTGGTLSDIAHIDNREAISLLGGSGSLFEGKPVDIVGMCDVTNPLSGENGAAHVFAPQKGASREDVLLLDKGLKHLVSQMDRDESVASGSILFPGNLSVRSMSDLPGSGAAGGLGFGIRAFAGGRLEKGIDLMLDTVDFDRHLWNADCVITGEGRFDNQSINGKVVSGICERAQAEDVPVIILCGTCSAPLTSDNGAAVLTDNGTAVLTGNGTAIDHTHIIETGNIDFAELSPDEIKKQAKQNIINALPRLAKIL